MELPEAKSVRKQAQTINDLKTAIAQEIANIDGKMLERTTRNIMARLEECMEGDGQHLRDLILGKP